MQIAIVTLFPEMFEALSGYGISGRAVREGLLDLSYRNPRDYTEDRHRTVDDRPYGGGPGMVMLYEPMKAAIQAAKRELGQEVKTVYLSPQGRPLDQAGVDAFTQQDKLLLIAGRYEGIDERLIESEIDEEWSIGDYVLSGGELPAMVMIDAIVRQLPGALGDERSAQEDSFVDGLLDCPHYTRPEQIDGMAVPDVLLSGHHRKIRQWRNRQSLLKTWQKRPDLLSKIELTQEQMQIIAELMEECPVDD